MEKKFKKYKKREKTRIKKISTGEYSYNPVAPSASSTLTPKYNIGVLKESKSDYLYDVDIITSFMEDIIDLGFSVTAYVNVSRVGVGNSHQERGDIFKMKEFLEKTPSWSIGTISYSLNINSNKKGIDSFNVLKSNLDSLRGRLEDMTNCRVDSLIINSDVKYSENYVRGEYVKNENMSIHASMTISNIKSKRDKISNLEN